jgi:hypothetical protein
MFQPCAKFFNGYVLILLLTGLTVNGNVQVFSLTIYAHIF